VIKEVAVVARGCDGAIVQIHSLVHTASAHFRALDGNAPARAIGFTSFGAQLPAYFNQIILVAFEVEKIKSDLSKRAADCLSCWAAAGATGA